MRSIWHYYKTYFLKVYSSVLRNITKVLHYLQVQYFRKIFSTFIFFIRRGNTQNVKFIFNILTNPKSHQKLGFSGAWRSDHQAAINPI